MRMQDSPGYLGKGDELAAIQSYIWKSNTEYVAADLVRPLRLALPVPCHLYVRPGCSTCYCCSLISPTSSLCLQAESLAKGWPADGFH